ncbi:MAG: peptidoglycan recognition protein family protein, partial [Nanoarchaeota archaeon]|nr:peptidoglycan recognition protein family protein [Nanoarchaeota archaeon]
VINENGEIFYTRPLRFKGAHAVPNSGKIGIAFASNLNWEKPTKKAFESYIKLVKVLRRRFNIPKENIIGHIQQQIRNLNYNLNKYNVPLKLTEERMLKINGLNELKAIKKYEYKRLKKLKVSKNLLPLVRCLKACPGLRFYKYL